MAVAQENQDEGQDPNDPLQQTLLARQQSPWGQNQPQESWAPMGGGGWWSGGQQTQPFVDPFGQGSSGQQGSGFSQGPQASSNDGWESVVPFVGPGWEYRPNPETGQVDTRPMTPNPWNNGGWGSEGPGGLSGKGPFYRFDDPKYQPPSGSGSFLPGEPGTGPNAPFPFPTGPSAPGGGAASNAPPGLYPDWYKPGSKDPNMANYVPTFANTPAGFDNRKWADPNKHDPKYDAGRVIASGGTLAEAARAAGGEPVGVDKIRMPDGSVYDVIEQANDPNGTHKAQWIPVAGPAMQAGGGGGVMSPQQAAQRGLPAGAQTYTAGAAGASTGGGAGAGGSTSGGGGGSTGSSTSSIYDTLGGTPWQIGGSRSNSLYDTLLNRANQSLNIDSQDPIIANQLNAFNANQTRQNRHYLEGVAEKAGPQANLAGETRMANERAAQAGGQFQAELMGRELQARRGEIQNALAQMGSFLTDEQRMGLQRELANLDNAYRYYAANQQNAQFYGRLGLDAEDRASYWDAVRSGLTNG